MRRLLAGSAVIFFSCGIAWAQTAGMDSGGLDTGVSVPSAPTESAPSSPTQPSHGSGPTSPPDCLGPVIAPPCQGPSLPSQPSTPPPSRPAPPAAPSSDEVRNRTEFPDAELYIDPDIRGLAGLLAEFWTTTTQPVSSTSTLRGYTIVATATPDHYSWDFGDGTSAIGEKVSHTYETLGDFDITLTITYSGSFTYSGNGTSGSGSLGTASHESTRSYHVIEARAVLR